MKTNMIVMANGSSREELESNLRAIIVDYLKADSEEEALAKTDIEIFVSMSEDQGKRLFIGDCRVRIR